MTDIFEEVEENVRRDKLQEFGKKYGAFLIAGAVALVMGVGGVGLYRSWHADRSKDASQEFVTLQELAQTDPAAAEPKLAAFAKTAHGGYKALAEMERASVLQAQGDLPGAILAFETAARLSSDTAVKQSALLRAAYIAAESEPYAALEARVKPLIDGSGAFGYLARELLAIEAFEAGETERARAHFDYLATAFDAPQGVRERAQRYSAVLGPAPETAPAAASEPSTPAAAANTGEKK
ncbi:MAG: tetratricopeptide repeat protein [Hyphomonadaceae bacterium]|nr:tetratricopeptide repeat protein [Hyphomonadaceae bacterium]